MKNTIITVFLVVIVMVLTSFTFKEESAPLIVKVSKETTFKIENVNMDLIANTSVGGNKKND
ncbi:hypothetical protein FVB9288_02971 [Flavobacterium sp. CECT 9288]|jgi:hypothetical protein|uniref:hypothetical protein n=1 Tax=unclassified Flavobacterium TaxID=196869 RepID=UPI000A3ACFC1|nr:MULTISPECIES: hypothetical protein [unclassified Flavobacterium]OUD33928.1 hypothetical protein FPG59_13830 [Flavobacterium sp. FPG59]CAH0337220.1 hypothetical protein FVB9288_02971 [Flavobacterium sp. CECT 9288]